MKLFLFATLCFTLTAHATSGSVLVSQQEAFKSALEDFQAKKAAYETARAAPNFARECPNMPDPNPQGGNPARHISMQAWFREFESHGNKYKDQLQSSAVELNLALGQPVNTGSTNACDGAFETITRELATRGQKIEQERDKLDAIQRDMKRDMDQSIHAGHPTALNKPLCREYSQKREQARMSALNMYRKMKDTSDYLYQATFGMRNEITRLNTSRAACTGR